MITTLCKWLAQGNNSGRVSVVYHNLEMGQLMRSWNTHIKRCSVCCDASEKEPRKLPQFFSKQHHSSLFLLQTHKPWTYKLDGRVCQTGWEEHSSLLLPERSFKIQVAARTPRLSAFQKALYPDAGGELQNSHMVLEHILFIPIPDSSKVTTEVTFGPAVYVIPK